MNFLLRALGESAKVVARRLQEHDVSDRHAVVADRELQARVHRRRHVGAELRDYLAFAKDLGLDTQGATIEELVPVLPRAANGGFGRVAAEYDVRFGARALMALLSVKRSRLRPSWRSAPPCAGSCCRTTSRTTRCTTSRSPTRPPPCSTCSGRRGSRRSRAGSSGRSTSRSVNGHRGAENRRARSHGTEPAGDALQHRRVDDRRHQGPVQGAGLEATWTLRPSRRSSATSAMP